MNIRERVLKETENASDIVLSEVLEYFQYLKAKHQQKMPETALRSEIDKLAYDSDALPIWELVAQISTQVPDEEWQKLPTDLSKRFDDYQQQRQGQD
jgi:hypothetical protein